MINLIGMKNIPRYPQSCIVSNPAKFSNYQISFAVTTMPQQLVASIQSSPLTTFVMPERGLEFPFDFLWKLRLGSEKELFVAPRGASKDRKWKSFLPCHILNRQAASGKSSKVNNH